MWGFWRTSKSGRPSEPSERESCPARVTACPGKVGALDELSFKEELIGRLPAINDVASFRKARTLLCEEFGGPMALHQALLEAGYICPSTDLLTTDRQPYNLFARIASGKAQQPGMEAEQAALGVYKDRFCICKNSSEKDRNWSSEYVGHMESGSSMAKRHRLLTTRNLHWQWFNVLVWGLVPESAGGACLQEALEEAEDLRAAASTYAKEVGGWSDDIGIFVNVFGYTKVNSLHVHVLDLGEIGPSFNFNVSKICPLDVVIRVLEEDACVPEPSLPFMEATLTHLVVSINSRGTRESDAARAESDAARGDSADERYDLSSTSVDSIVRL